MGVFDPERLAEVRAAYAEGRNVMELMRNRVGTNQNTTEIIETAYDLQAGSYTKHVLGDINGARAYAGELAALLAEHLSEGETLLDVGTGEMTTLALVLEALPARPPRTFAFDISWSRLAWGRAFVADILGDPAPVSPFVAEIGAIPLADGAVDVVTSSHALEPNAATLSTLLAELFRVARQKLVLFEPYFEGASEEGRARMERLGYIRGLEKEVVQLGGSLEHVVPIRNLSNPLNPTFCFVIKPPMRYPQKTLEPWSVPGTSWPLSQYDGYWHSADTGLVFPEIKGLPVLRPSSAILASALGEEGAWL